jgi:acetyl esterase
VDAEQQTQAEAIIAAIEAMDGETMAAMMPKSPDPSVYLDVYPALREVETRDVSLAGPHGKVLGRIYRHPSASNGAALVWVHGGGFVGGDLDMPEAHWVSLTLAAQGFGVLSVDYRKCVQGVHYPIPSDDVMAAWLWAVDHVAELGATLGRLHLGGASAGGSLTAGVTKRLRDTDGVLPASLVLAYPTLHPDLLPADGDAAVDQTPNPAAGIMRWMNMNYTGSEALLDDPYVFPGFGDLSGQPPVYILNSNTDALRPSGELYAKGLAAAGVTVTVEHEPGTGHGHLNEPLMPEAVRSIERIAAWLSSDR